jgi:hypothetical protein
MTTSVIRAERQLSTRTQSLAIITAGFGQNVILTTVTT